MALGKPCTSDCFAGDMRVDSPLAERAACKGKGRWEWINTADLAHEITGPRADRNVVRELEVDAQNALVGLGVTLGLKGRCAEQELIAEHTQAPDVHAGIMVLPL